MTAWRDGLRVCNIRNDSLFNVENNDIREKPAKSTLIWSPDKKI